MAKPFETVSRYIFRISPDFFPVFLISQAAGYPIGAALIDKMTEEKKISPDEASQMLCFCIAPGPAYIAAVARAAAPDTPGICGSVFTAVMGANLLGLLLTSFKRKIPPPSDEKAEITFSAKLFTDSVRSGAESMTSICSMIIFMAAVMGILGKAGVLKGISLILSEPMNVPAPKIYPFIRSFLEISNLTVIFGDYFLTIPAAAALLSFGGICVHLQIISVCRSFSPLPAIICRIPCAAAAFFICRMTLPDYFPTAAVSANADMSNEILMISNNQPILSIFLLIMTILILSQKSMVKKQKM